MGDVPAIGSDTSVSTPSIISEELTESQVKGLVEEAKTAIKEQNFDQARDIITRLSQMYHQAQVPKGWVDTFRGWISGSKCHVTRAHLYDLFYALCKENHEEGKKLIPVLSENFSIDVDGNHYKVNAREFNRSFTLPIKTDPEAKTLMDDLSKLAVSRKFEELKGELPRLANLCAERKVAMMDFMKFYFSLVFANSTFAVRSIPIFEEAYKMQVEGNRLSIVELKGRDSTTLTVRSLPLVDCDRNLKEIAAKEKPLDRFSGYLFLAKHQLERADEVIRKAEQEIDHIDDPMMRFSTILSTAIFYQKNHDEQNFVRMAAILERELTCAEESEKTHYFLAKLNVFRALTCLEKKDRSGYNDAIVKVAQEIKSVKEAKPFEILQKDLEFLKSKREETFPIDQMEWQAMKV